MTSLCCSILAARLRAHVGALPAVHAGMRLEGTKPACLILTTALSAPVKALGMTLPMLLQLVWSAGGVATARLRAPVALSMALLMLHHLPRLAGGVGTARLRALEPLLLLLLVVLRGSSINTLLCWWHAAAAGLQWIDTQGCIEE